MTNLYGIIPMLIVMLAGIAAMLAEAFRQPGERMPMFGLGLIGLFGAAAAAIVLWDTNASSFGVVRSDNFALFVDLILCAIGVLTMVFSHGVVEREGIPAGEYYALTLFGIAGMMLMASATDLLIIFLALEVLSLSVYVLTGIRRASAAGAEAAFKYFLLGAFSSAFFLYGIAFAFAISGSTRLDDVAVAMASGSNGTLALLAVGLLAVGFAFKVSAVPFHMWTPDVYEGAPTPITAFFSAAPKVAAICLFTRVLVDAFGGLTPQWQQIIFAISVASMILGAFAAIGQRNIKRLMAYSAIGNAGYALVGLAAGTQQGVSGLLFYMAAYVPMTLGSFAVILAMRQKGRMVEEIADLSGLAKSQPWLAHVFAALLFSLAGIPPLLGFFGKWMVFVAAVNQSMFVLVVIGVLTSVVSAYYYVRIVRVMYFDEAVGSFDRVDGSLKLVLAVSVAVVVAGILFINPIQSSAIAAASSLFPG